MTNLPLVSLRRKGTVVATDLDGTLVYIDDELHSASHPSSHASVKQLKEAGVPIIPLTGRGPFLGKKVLDPLGVSIYPGAFHHGSITYDPAGTKIINQTLNIGVVEAIKLAQSRLRVDHPAIYGVIMIQTEDDHYVGNDPKGTATQHILKHGSHLVVDVPDNDFKITDPIYQCTYFHDTPADYMNGKGRDVIVKAINDAMKDLGVNDTKTFASGFHYVDTINAHVDKAYALQALSKSMNFEMGDVVALGDADNDRQMLESVGESIAMGNALPNIKAQSKYIVAPAMEGGWSEGINRVVFGSVD